MQQALLWTDNWKRSEDLVKHTAEIFYPTFSHLYLLHPSGLSPHVLFRPVFCVPFLFPYVTLSVENERRKSTPRYVESN
jgi:hypothetical protein